MKLPSARQLFLLAVTVSLLALPFVDPASAGEDPTPVGAENDAQLDPLEEPTGGTCSVESSAGATVTAQPSDGFGALAA